MVSTISRSLQRNGKAPIFPFHTFENATQAAPHHWGSLKDIQECVLGVVLSL